MHGAVWISIRLEGVVAQLSGQELFFITIWTLGMDIFNNYSTSSSRTWADSQRGVENSLRRERVE